MRAAPTSTGLAKIRLTGEYVIGSWAAGAAFSATRPHSTAADGGRGADVDAFFAKVQQLHAELDTVASDAERQVACDV